MPKEIAIKNRMDYCDIGFRAESSIEALEDYKNGKFNELLIEDALNIITPLYKFYNLQGEDCSSNKMLGTYLKIFSKRLELLDKNPDQMKELLKEKEELIITKRTLEKIILNQNVEERDLQTSIGAFRRLSKECMISLS